MGVKRWQSGSPLITEILAKINSSDDAVITEIRGLNFVRAVLLMEQSGCNSSDIEYVKDLALKQFMAHDNIPGLFVLMADWDVSNDKIKELAKTPIDSPLTFLNYKTPEINWENIKTKTKTSGSEVVKISAENLATTQSLIGKLRPDLIAAREEIHKLEEETRELELKSARLKTEANIPALEEKESKKFLLEAKPGKVTAEATELKVNLEAAEFKVIQLEKTLADKNYSDKKIETELHEAVKTEIALLEQALGKEGFSDEKIKADLRRAKNRAVKHEIILLEEALRNESSFYEKLTTDLLGVKDEAARLKAVSRKLEPEADIKNTNLEALKIKENQQAIELKAIQLEEELKRSELKTIELKLDLTKNKRERVDLQIEQLELDLKKAELRTAELNVALTNAKRKLSQL
jgi:hypothetical protein